MAGGVEDYCRRVDEALAGAAFEQKGRLVVLSSSRHIRATDSATDFFE